MANKKPVPAEPPAVSFRVVHLGTTIQSIFGVMDENGNIGARRPATLESEFLSPEALTAAMAAMQQEARRYGAEFGAVVPESFAPLPE